MQLHIVFHAMPGPEPAQLIEIEDGTGRSVSAGEWRMRQDGKAELLLNVLDSEVHVGIAPPEPFIVEG